MVVLEHAIEDEDSVMSCAAIWEWTGPGGCGSDMDRLWIKRWIRRGSGVDQAWIRRGSGVDQTRRAWIG